MGTLACAVDVRQMAGQDTIRTERGVRMQNCRWDMSGSQSEIVWLSADELWNDGAHLVRGTPHLAEPGLHSLRCTAIGGKVKLISARAC